MSFNFLPATAMMIPVMLTTIPKILFTGNISARKSHPIIAVIIGARLMISCEVRDPIRV